MRLPETCTGASAFCPIDGFASSAFPVPTVQRACNPTDYCSGSTATCPVDMLRKPRGHRECIASGCNCDASGQCRAASAMTLFAHDKYGNVTLRASLGQGDVCVAQ